MSLSTKAKTMDKKQFKTGVNHFIVYSKERHEQFMDIKNDKGERLAYPSFYDDHHNSIKEAEIVAAPPRYEGTVGGNLIFNTFITHEHSASGNHEIAPGYFKVFFSENDPGASSCYGWVQSGTLFPFPGFVFLQEVYEQIEETTSGLVLVQNIDDNFYESGEQKPRKEHGKVAYINPADAEKLEIQRGNVVKTRNSVGYRQKIGGKELIRVRDASIVAKETV